MTVEADHDNAQNSMIPFPTSVEEMFFEKDDGNDGSPHWCRGHDQRGAAG